MRRIHVPARTVVALIAIVVPLLAGGCLTSARIDALGDEAAAQIDESMGLLQDDELVGYVREIGLRLVAVSERPDGPWRFQIADAPEPNAFALPGGHIYVTRGLLALVNSEDELAGVIGHEIAHVTARHSAKRINASLATSPVTIATGIAGLATSIVSPSVGQAVAGSGQVLTRGLVLAPYSRGQESEADRIGQELAARAGYDPAALSSFLETLGRESQLRGARDFSFLSDHPSTPDRVEKTALRAQQLERGPGRPIASGSLFLGRIEGIVVGSDPAQGVFRDDLFLHPALDFSLAMPTGWSNMNSNTAAAAVSPSEDAVLVLRLAAKDRSLEDLLDEAARERPDVGFERFEVRGQPAARAELSRRGRTTSVFWVAHRGDVLEVVGQCRSADSSRYAPVFKAAVESFRALSRSQLASIEEVRLRVRSAKSGETPARIASRVGSEWQPEEIAVANAVAPDGVFRTGEAVKVAIRERYSRRR